MKLFGRGRARARADELFKRIYASRSAPQGEMAELIELGRRDDEAREVVLEQLLGLLRDGGDDLGVSWLLIVAGELGPEGVVAVLWSIGRGDDPERLYGVSVPVLSRRGLAVLPLVLRAIHRSEPGERRALYRVLFALSLSADVWVVERLSVFALERLRSELEDPEEPGALMSYPLQLLYETDRAGFVEALGSLESGGSLDREARARLEERLGRGEHLSEARAWLSLDWRGLALQVDGRESARVR